MTVVSAKKFFLLLAMGLCCLAQSRPSLAAEAATLRLDWTALGYHAPFFLALQRGYYREQDIDLKIEEGKGSGTGIQLVGNGVDTFAFADAATAAKSISNGIPVKVAMGIIQHSPLAIVYPIDRGIRGPEDLKGKLIATCGGSGGVPLLPAYLKSVNLVSSDIKLIVTECSAYFPLVAQGKADASISYFPVAKSVLGSLGINNLGRLLFWDAGVMLPAHGIVVSTETIKRNPQLIRRFVIATAKGWREAAKDPAAAVDAMVASFPLLKGKETTLSRELADTMEFVTAAEVPGKGFGWQSPDEWKKSERILIEYLDMKPAATLDAYFTNEFIP
jgi:NitT/TauT family transport system substrate-binding protein